MSRACVIFREIFQVAFANLGSKPGSNAAAVDMDECPVEYFPCVVFYSNNPGEKVQISDLKVSFWEIGCGKWLADVVFKDFVYLEKFWNYTRSLRLNQEFLPLLKTWKNERPLFLNVYFEKRYFSWKKLVYTGTSSYNDNAQ